MADKLPIVMVLTNLAHEEEETDETSAEKT